LITAIIALNSASQLSKQGSCVANLRIAGHRPKSGICREGLGEEGGRRWIEQRIGVDADEQIIPGLGCTGD